MVFGRRPHHGRPADVDVFYRFFRRYARPGNGFPEGIEIDHHQIDGLDALFLKLSHMFRQGPGQDGAVDFGVEGFDPTVQNFRKTGDFRHFGDRQSGFP